MHQNIPLRPTEAYNQQFEPWQPDSVAIQVDSGRKHIMPVSHMYYSAIILGQQGDIENHSTMLDTVESALYANGFLSILMQAYKQEGK